MSLVLDANKLPSLKTPNGLAMDGASHLLLADWGSGELHRIKLADGSTQKLADGFKGADGLAWDNHGRLFISDWDGGKIFVHPPARRQARCMAEGFKIRGDICLDPTGKFLSFPT